MTGPSEGRPAARLADLVALLWALAVSLAWLLGHLDVYRRALAAVGA